MRSTAVSSSSVKGSRRLDLCVARKTVVFLPPRGRNLLSLSLGLSCSKRIFEKNLKELLEGRGCRDKEVGKEARPARSRRRPGGGLKSRDRRASTFWVAVKEFNLCYHRRDIKEKQQPSICDTKMRSEGGASCERHVRRACSNINMALRVISTYI